MGLLGPSDNPSLAGAYFGLSELFWGFVKASRTYFWVSEPEKFGASRSLFWGLPALILEPTGPPGLGLPGTDFWSLVLFWWPIWGPPGAYSGNGPPAHFWWLILGPFRAYFGAFRGLFWSLQNLPAPCGLPGGLFCGPGPILGTLNFHGTGPA